MVRNEHNRTQCSRCGAFGGNITTCPGNQAAHAAVIAGGDYERRSNPTGDPYNTGAPRGPYVVRNRDNPPDDEEVQAEPEVRVVTLADFDRTPAGEDDDRPPALGVLEQTDARITVLEARLDALRDALQ